MLRTQTGLKHFSYMFGSLLFISTIAIATPPEIIQVQNQILEPTPTTSDEFFGGDVCVDGNQLMIGSPEWFDTDLDERTGIAKMYEFNTSTGDWIETANLTPIGSNFDESLHGAAVSIQGDVAVVGAPFRNTGTGAVSIYTRSGNDWAFDFYFQGDAGDQFGTSVAQTANFIAVGAPFNDSAAIDAGAVYIWKQLLFGWSGPTVITGDNASSGNAFGTAVYLFTDQDGIDWLVVGAPNAGGAGEVQLFQFETDANNWVHTVTLIPSSPQSIAPIGESVSMTQSNDGALWVFAGSPLYDLNNNCDSNGNLPPGDFDNGVVEIYKSSGTNWSWSQTLLPPDCLAGAKFGFSVDASGEQLAIGSPAGFSCDLTTLTTGAGYVARYDAAHQQWEVKTKLIPSETGNQTNIGVSITIDGDSVAVGAPTSNSAKAFAYMLEDVSPDCNGDGISDAAELCSGAGDCNNNNIPDFCEVIQDPTLDCDGNGFIDSCEIEDDPALDCNENSILDVCDISQGTSEDCNSNYIPDECDLMNPANDCDGNGVLDACEIEIDPALDCNGNDILDSCELTGRLFLTFLIDGSSSITPEKFEQYLESITDVLCDESIYDALEIIVSVIQYHDFEPIEIEPVLFHADSTEICAAISVINYGAGSTENLFFATEQAEIQFLEVGPFYSREIIVIGDGAGITPEVLNKASTLRSLTPPVRICTALGEDDDQCSTQNVIAMKNLANTADAEEHDGDQVTGYYTCFPFAGALAPLCVECLIEEPATGWILPFSVDCNANGIMDECDVCPADVSDGDGPGHDGEINVSDLLVVVGYWGTCPESDPCYGDINCDGVVDVLDLLEVIGNWGPDCELAGLGIPKTVQDCLDRFPLGSLQLEKCLEVVEWLESQSN